MSTESVRGAARSRGGATDTTMLIWKVIAASPGITRAQIWERVEHDIPAGYAARLYVRHGKTRTRDPSLVRLDRARSFVLTEALKKMRREPAMVTSVGDESDRRYTAVRQPHYYGNPDAVDETGTRAAELMAIADALSVVEKALARCQSPDHRAAPRLYGKLRDAVEILARAQRAKQLPRT